MEKIDTLSCASQDEIESSEKVLKPIPREHAFLETFFYTMAQFQFDRGRELAEKERDTFKPSIGLAWTSLLHVLINFSNAEKSYFTMGFIEKKLFKQTMRPLYFNLSVDLVKQVDMSSNLTSESPEVSHGVEALALDLSKQLNQFILARLKMIDFYEFMAKSGWSHIQNTAEIIKSISEISIEYSKNFHHPILDPIKTSFTHEVDIVQTLFQAQLQLSEWEFLSSLLYLRESQAKLQVWCELSPTTSVKEQLLSSFSYKSFFSRTIKKQSDIPFLYQWLSHFYLQLLSKFTFYFYTALSKQAPPTDLKAATAKTSIDYISKLITFQKKTDVTRISLVLDTTTKKKIFCGHGYHLDTTIYEKPTGINSYPSVLNIPENTLLKEHWLNVISLINDKSEELKIKDKVVYFYDTKLISSYYFLKIDVRMTLVLIYEIKKKERDNYIHNFLMDIRACLNHDKLYFLLRPGQVKSF